MIIMPKKGALWQDAQAGKLLRSLAEKKTVAQIAEEEGVTSRAIAYRMQRPLFQEMLAKFTVDLVETALRERDELWASSDPLDKRAAFAGTVSLVKTFSPRISHSTSENLNVNLEEQHIKVQRSWDNLSPEEQEKMDEMLIKMDRQV